MHGRRVLEKIRQATAEVDARHLAVGRQLAAHERTLVQAAAAREQVFLDLAEQHVPDIETGVVEQLRRSLPELSEHVDQLLVAREARRSELEQMLADNGKDRGGCVEELERVTGAVDAQAAQRDHIEAQVLDDLAERPAWKEAVAARDQAAARREQAGRRLEAANEERDDKLPAYQADPLFAYLLERRYATPAYRGGWLARRLDAWVARKVDFEAQFDHYRLIDEVPAVLTKEIERLGTQVDRADEAVRTQLEQQGAERGLPEVLEHGERLMQQRHALEARVEQLDADSTAARSELGALDDDGGSYYQRALDAYRDYLQAADLQRLRELAALTPSASDDRLVPRIATLEEQERQAREQLTVLGGERHGLAAEAERVRRLERDFTARGFDAANSRFRKRFDIDEVVTALVGGALSIADAMARVAKHQYFEVQRRRPRRQAPFPGFPGGLGGGTRGGSRGGSRGGGFGGWGGRSTGGFGRGGSRTTGGFGRGGSRSTGGFGKR